MYIFKIESLFLIAFHQQLNILHDLLLLLKYFELFEFHILLATSLALLSLNDLLYYIHLLLESFIIGKHLKVLLSLADLLSNLLFFEVSSPFLSLKSISEAFDHKDSVLCQLTQTCYTFLNGVLFFQNRLQLKVFSVLSRDKLQKVLSHLLVVVPMFLLCLCLDLLDLFLVIANYAPLDGLFLALELSDHFLCHLHLLPLFLHLLVYLLVLLI
jgi:hypothetical protein